MNITCHGCGRQFRVRQDKLPAQGARTRCPRCSEVLVIAPPGSESTGTPPSEVETHPPIAMEGDLFDLPPSDLLASEDDLFALGEQDMSSQPTEPIPAVGDHAGAGMDEASELTMRPGGLRGWLARLFSRES
jgi:predicted Zn finger-like uncharacterized protein